MFNKINVNDVIMEAILNLKTRGFHHLVILGCGILHTYKLIIFKNGVLAEKHENLKNHFLFNAILYDVYTLCTQK